MRPAMSDDLTVIHEYDFEELPKRKLLELFHAGAKLYKICQNTSCVMCHEYQPIVTDAELMTYCLQCGRKVLKYGLEKPLTSA